MKINSISSQSFGALPVSQIRVKGIDSLYKLYDATSLKDNEFLNELYMKINLSELMPDLSEKQLHTWDTMFRHSSVITDDDCKILLETCNDVPCGILNYNRPRGIFHVNYAVTLPDRFNQRVPCAGQVMFNELFRRFAKSDANKIELIAMSRGPFNPVTKYLDMGFNIISGDFLSEFMRAYRTDIAKTLAKQNEFIDVKYIKDAEDVELGKIIKLQA